MNVRHEESMPLGKVVMFGTDLHTPGGITAVVRSYRDAGLFSRWPVRFIATYRGSGAFSKVASALIALGQFASALVREHVGVVHVHSASRGSFWRKSMFLVLGRVCGCRTVFHLHSGEFPVFYREESGALAKRYIRWVLRNADVVVVLTDGWIPVIREIEPTARVIVLYNPVCVPAAPRVSPEGGGADVLFLGRLRDKKGVFDLVRAAGAIAGRFPRMRLVLAGDGDQSLVREVAREAGIESRLVLPGWVEGAEKRRLMDSAAVFVLPSYFEGLPVGVLEAMAVGVPVVASRVGGIPDVIEDGVDGWLMKPGDVGGLAACISKVLEDPARAEQMAVRAHAKARARFDADKVVESVAALYEGLADVRGEKW